MKKKLDNAEKTITVKQIKSVARRPAIQNEYLKGLGLGKMNKVRVLRDTPGVRGLLIKAQHLIEIVEVK
jgi:large subunit ribosomal protein L30